jgi:hypothetical protein
MDGLKLSLLTAGRRVAARLASPSGNTLLNTTLELVAEYVFVT